MKEHPTKNIFWQNASIDAIQRARLKSQHGACIWLTGLSGAGKSSVARQLEQQLHEHGHHTFLLDGDNVRHGLCGDLGFSAADRDENIRRVGEVAKLFVDAGVIVIAAFISPYQARRDWVRSIMPTGQFFEVWVKCPLEVCEDRDPKGLYEKVRRGEISNFTGVDAPYEEPDACELVLRTDRDANSAASAKRVLEMLDEVGMLRPPEQERG